MQPQLVLSNTTTFFSGRLEAAFRKAKRHGIKYLEILPYRWTTPQQILRLEKKYGIRVVGIHLPVWWKTPPKVFGPLFTAVCRFYQGNGVSNPGIAIAEALSDRRPYLLVHSDLVPAMGSRFAYLKQKFNVVVENIPGETDMVALSKIAPLVFDAGHYGSLPEIEQAYQQARPYIFHISYYHAFPYAHDLPNEEEQKTIQRLLLLHQPKYIVLETYPWVSVRKGKQVLEKIINETLEA